MPNGQNERQRAGRIFGVWQDSSLNDGTSEGWRHGLSLICPSPQKKSQSGGRLLGQIDNLQIDLYVKRHGIKLTWPLMDAAICRGRDETVTHIRGDLSGPFWGRLMNPPLLLEASTWARNKCT